MPVFMVIVAEHFGIKVGDLTRHGHVAGAAKRAAMEAATRVTGLGLVAIGAHYGRISASAVSMNRGRLRPEDYSGIKDAMRALDSY